jgi:endonuclease/exonuclease/phosphatase (EEP) superfamily protein YafD
MRRSDPIAILTAIVALAIAALTGAGFAARAAWTFDLAASFRPQYAVIAGAAAIVLLVRRRLALAGGAAAVALLNAALVVPLYFGGATTPADASSLTMVSHNLNGVDDRIEEIVTALPEEDADILIYFESPHVLRDEVAAVESPYEVAFSNRGDDDVNLLVLSRIPVVGARMLDLGSESRSETVTVELAIDGAPIHVLGIRTRSPREPERAEVRRDELTAVQEWVRAQDDPVVVIGDLNATPWHPDFRDLVAGAELRNSQRGFGIQPTWPTWFPPAMIPIDHALHTEDLVAVDRELGEHHGSPHRALRVEYALAADRLTDAGER